MTQTVIGVFDTSAQADRAIEQLAQAGITRADVQLHTDDRTVPAAAAELGSAFIDPLGAAGGPGVLGTPEGSGMTGGFTTTSRPESASDVNAARGSTAMDDGTGTTGYGAVGGGAREIPPGEGLMERIEHFFGRLFGGGERPPEAGHYAEAVRRGGVLLSVNVRDESRVEEVRSLLWDAGAVDIDERVAQWQSTGYAGDDAGAQSYDADAGGSERQAVPVVREELAVGKRERNVGALRVYSRVTETPVSETVNLREEHATIERRPVDRPATAEDLKGGWVEVRETAEEAVVSKTARVVEEVVVGKEASQRQQTVSDTVRGTEVEVERVDSGQDRRGMRADVSAATSGGAPGGTETGGSALAPAIAASTADPLNPTKPI